MALSEISRQYLIINQNAQDRRLKGLQDLNVALIELSGMQPDNPGWTHARNELAEKAKAVVHHDMIEGGPHTHARRAITELCYPRSKSVKHLQHVIAQLVVAIKMFSETGRSAPTPPALVPSPSTAKLTTSLIAVC